MNIYKLIDKCIDQRPGKSHFSGMFNRFKIIFLFTLFTLIANADFAPAPTHEITCTADVMGPLSGIPLSGLAPVQMILKGNEDSRHWVSKIQKLEIQEKYKNFYHAYWIQPWEPLSDFASKALLAAKDFDRNHVSFRLSRFPQSETRVAGISVEYNIDNGFYAAFLIRPKIDGIVFTNLSPIKNSELPLTMSLHCFLRDEP